MNSRFLVCFGVLLLGLLVGCGSAIDHASPPDLLTLCKTGTGQQVRKAIAAGADVNAKDENGGTPLMTAAALNRNPDVIAAMVKAGANVNAKDARGKSVLQYGRQNKNAILAELIKAGAK